MKKLLLLIVTIMAMTGAQAAGQWKWSGERFVNYETPFYLLNIHFYKYGSGWFLTSNETLVNDPSQASMWRFGRRDKRPTGYIHDLTENNSSGHPGKYYWEIMQDGNESMHFRISKGSGLSANASITTNTKDYYKQICVDGRDDPDDGWDGYVYYFWHHLLVPAGDYKFQSENEGDVGASTNLSDKGRWMLISKEQVYAYYRWKALQAEAQYLLALPEQAVPLTSAERSTLMELVNADASYMNGVIDQLFTLTDKCHKWFDVDYTSSLQFNSAFSLPEGYYCVSAYVNNTNNDYSTFTIQAGDRTTVTWPYSPTTHQVAYTFHHNGGNLNIAYADNGNIQFSNVQLKQLDYKYDLTISSAQYATLAVRYNTKVPTGVQPYSIQDAQKSYTDLTLVPMNGSVIRATEGVVVYSGSPATYSFYRTDDEAVFIANNQLKGNLTRTTSKESGKAYYVLANKQPRGVGFYRLAADAAIPANRAYLMYADDASVREFYGFADDEETGLEALEGEQEIEAVYDLSGRRVSGAMKPGVNIIRMSDGTVRKVWVK